jgi:polyisoprenoid-binding protein YceI
MELRWFERQFDTVTTNFVLYRTSKEFIGMPELATSYTISPSNDSTIAIEISKTGLRRRKKHILFFDNFQGEMSFAEKDPESFKIALTIDAGSATCHDAWLSKRKRRRVAEFARESLATKTHPEIRFTSNSIRAKELRGFVIEGVLEIRGTTRVVKVNIVLGARRKDCWQLDGDATLRLGDFGLPRPSALFGLIGTKDEAVVRLLLWAIPLSEVKSANL